MVSVMRLRFGDGLRIGFCIIVPLVALVSDVWLADSFLTAPAGVFMYLVSAFPIVWGAYAIAAAVLSSGRDGDPVKRDSVVGRGSVLARFQCVAVALALLSIVVVPITSGMIADHFYHSNPIGVGDDVARGPCTAKDGEPASNHAGIEAVVRAAFCSGNWDGDSMYFVFVHGSGDANTRENLVFRYDTDPSPDMGPPKVFWKSATELHVDGYHFVVGAPFLRSRIGAVNVVCDSPFRSDR